MNKFFKIIIFIVIFSFSGEYVYSKAVNRLMQGKIQIPPEIAKATTISEIRPFLKDKDEEKRMAAVRRLGQIGDKKIVGLLVEVFEKEYYEPGMEIFPYVKGEIINVLEKIENNESKSALFNIFKDYLKRGPRLQKRPDLAYYDDGDYSCVTTQITKILYKLYDVNKDTKIYELFKKIALEELKDWWIIEDRDLMRTSFQINYKTEIFKNKLTKEETKKYLEKEFKKYKGKPFTTPEYIKIEAIRELLGELSIDISN